MSQTKCPRQNVPRQNVPRHNVPRQNVPRQNVPRQNVSRQQVPRQNVPVKVRVTVTGEEVRVRVTGEEELSILFTPKNLTRHRFSGCSWCSYPFYLVP